MNFEKIIVELLGRIQVLEEKFEALENSQNEKIRGGDNNMTINDIRKHIEGLKNKAKENGRDFLVLRSGDIHKDLELKRWMPPVCKAMYDCMNDGDIILHTTPSGFSSTIEIKYML